MNDKKIKIFYVTCALNVGGAEKFLFDLIKNLNRQTFAPSLVTVIGGGTMEKDFRDLGIPVYIYGRRRLRYLGGIVQFYQLYHLFKKQKPQIVHTQLFAADLWGRLAAWLAHVPIIITTEQNVNVDQSWLREFLKRLTYYFTDQVVAISSAVKKYTVARYGVPPEKIEIIPNDVDVENYELRSASWRTNYELRNFRPENKKIILTVGRLVEQKGHRYLLEAFSQLKEKENYELWLVGDGPLRSVLEDQAKELGVENQVKFLGERGDVPALLSQADLFVFPSLWEGLGIAVLEAAVAKVPIVASAVDGILDIIEDNETGYLAEPGDSEDLFSAMEQMFRNPNRAKYMVEKAYALVKRKFDVKVVVRKYELLYLRYVHSIKEL